MPLPALCLLILRDRRRITKGMVNETLTDEERLVVTWEMRLNGPAMKPPPGVKPNFNNYSQTSVLFRAVPIMCMAIGTLAVLVRFYVKARLMKKLHVEDCKCQPWPRNLMGFY